MSNDIKNLFGRDMPTPEYKPAHEPKDYGNARFYPTKSSMEGNRYVGKYHSIADAHGFNDRDPLHAYKSYEMDKFGPFTHVGSLKDGHTSVYQGPDGYYSTNPLITSMSFKTIDDLQDYANDPEKKYKMYGDGFYGIEGPDAYMYAKEGMPSEYASSSDDDLKRILNDVMEQWNDLPKDERVDKYNAIKREMEMRRRGIRKPE